LIYDSPHRCSACSRKYKSKRKKENGVKIDRKRSFHHIWPVEFFHGIGPKIDLCRQCHNELEKRIPHKTKKAKRWYEITLSNFLKEKRGMKG